MWYAIHTRSRHEKMVDAQLCNKGFDTFLPLYRVKRVWETSRREVDLPLFSCYVFCRFEPGDRISVRSTPGVVSIVSAASTPLPVDDAEIDAVRSIVESGRYTEPCDCPQSGEVVRVVEGPLEGVQGRLVRVKTSQRLVVSVTLLQRAVAVELDSESVRPIGGTVPTLTILSRQPAESLQI